jgi:hypothetical protein
VTDLPDYYAILGLPPAANQAEIRAAYRKLALAHHPDVSSGGRERDTANDTMSQINEAYEALSDPKRRAAYDRDRHPRRPKRHPYAPREPPTPAADGAPAPERGPPPSGRHAGRTYDPRGLSGPFEDGWPERWANAERRIREQFGPLWVVMGVLTPVLALAALLVAGFWAYGQVRADPSSWLLLTHVTQLWGGMGGVLLVAGAVLLVLISLFVWWRWLVR